MLALITPLQWFGLAIAVCTLGGGALWLTDGLIFDHVAPRWRLPVGLLVLLALLLIAATACTAAHQSLHGAAR
jgi:hypothetical protein